ncbi:MAG: hypothetical protein AB2A00_09550 [Myxococcota bacterium]
MKDLELVISERRGAAEVFRANPDHPDAALLRQLVQRRPVSPPRDEHAETVRGWLRDLGAPLVNGRAATPAPSEEDALADALKLAHRDASVARVLPLCLWYHRNHVDVARLGDRARADGEKHALGFMLDLTAEVCGDKRFAQWARELRDRRRRVVRDFFHGAPTSRRARELAERNTPDVARRWGYRMNMDLENFRALFQKFAHVTPVHAPRD